MTFGSALSCTDALVGESPAWQRVRTQIEQVAPTTSTVLIQGETGTGKELVCRAIHARSARRDRPMNAVNCAALPRDLVWSRARRIHRSRPPTTRPLRAGRLRHPVLRRDRELPLEMQRKLLRVLQQREFQRIGASRDLRTDVRVGPVLPARRLSDPSTPAA